MNRRQRRAAERGRMASVRAWLSHHAASFQSGPRHLAARPLGAVMTLGVIAVALAMPAGLHLAVKNLQRLGGAGADARQITLYLEVGANAVQAEALRESVAGYAGVAQVAAIDPTESLAQFEVHSGFTDALDMLGDNPLPWVLVITPEPDLDSAAVVGLANALHQQPDVDFAQLDLQWLNRLNALLDLAGRASAVLAMILAVAVALIVGNTIRLELQSRGEEIAIARLLGATDGFVRRPFLYLGAWYGLLGGAAAIALVTAMVLAVQGPVSELAESYDSRFVLAGPGRLEIAVLVLGGAAIGWLGAALVVTRQIAALDLR